MIGVIDYGLGNIQAFLNIYKRLNIPAMAVKTIAEMERADKLILPGVGAFDWAMSRLEASGLKPILGELVLERKVPILGVCVGMQMLAQRSSEGELAGLGWLDAVVLKMDSSEGELPHMGWNDVSPSGDARIFNDIPNPRFYFLHSYYFCANNPEDVLATTRYTIDFCSAVNAGNIYGTQFHPEKSHRWGIQLLKNFSEL